MDYVVGESHTYTHCSYGFFYEHDTEAMAQSLADHLRSMNSGLIDVVPDPRRKKWIVTQYIESFKEMKGYTNGTIQ